MAQRVSWVQAEAEARDMFYRALGLGLKGKKVQWTRMLKEGQYFKGGRPSVEFQFKVTGVTDARGLEQIAAEGTECRDVLDYTSDWNAEYRVTAMYTLSIFDMPPMGRQIGMSYYCYIDGIRVPIGDNVARIIKELAEYTDFALYFREKPARITVGRRHLYIHIFQF